MPRRCDQRLENLDKFKGLLECCFTEECEMLPLYHLWELLLCWLNMKLRSLRKPRWQIWDCFNLWHFPNDKLGLMTIPMFRSRWRTLYWLQKNLNWILYAAGTLAQSTSNLHQSGPKHTGQTYCNAIQKRLKLKKERYWGQHYLDWPWGLLECRRCRPAGHPVWQVQHGKSKKNWAHLL